MTTTKYDNMANQVGEKVQMCMNTPIFVDKNNEALTGNWDDPTQAATFSYTCPKTPFTVQASAFDEFFDYAINYKDGNNPLLKKAGLPYDQCKAKADCPEEINGNPACCVDSTLTDGDYTDEGELVNQKNSTVKRCMKQQIPNAKIFTEIDKYIVDMKCIGMDSFGTHLAVMATTSIAVLFATISF